MYSYMTQHNTSMRNESVVQEVVALVALVRSKQALVQRGLGVSQHELTEVFEDIVCHCHHRYM